MIPYYVVVLCVYVLFSLSLYAGNTTFYTMYSTLLRKGLYSLFIILMGIGILTRAIDYTDWAFFLSAVATIVFIDLSIFQTPNILKIWSAEFQHADTIVENIKKNEKRIQHMNMKANVFTMIVQSAEELLNNIGPVNSKENYKKELITFIQNYTDQFDFQVHLYYLPEDFHPEDLFLQHIENALFKIGHTYNAIFKDKKAVRDELYHAKVFPFDENVIIPIYEGTHNFLLVISSKQEAIIEIDTTNIINLVTIFNFQF
jgi:hypothetical protein